MKSSRNQPCDAEKEPLSPVSEPSAAETWHERFIRLGATKDYAGCLAMMREPLAPNWSSPEYTIVPLTPQMARAQSDMWQEAKARALSAEARVRELLETCRLYHEFVDIMQDGPDDSDEAMALARLMEADAKYLALRKALGLSTADTSDRQSIPGRHSSES